MIKGAKNILMNSNAKLAIAAYHKVNNKITAPFVADELKKLGYKTKIDYKTHLTVYARK